jgi:5-oxoprolinase (ATP-hydrolysing)
MKIAVPSVVSPWNIWVDTGGTFTDCMAISPHLDQLKLKVLSSGCLKARIIEKVSASTYRFKHKWPIDTDIFQGYTASFKLATAQESAVEAIDFHRNLLKLQKDLNISGEVDFEISAHEEAPVLACRIATKTPLGKDFPVIRLRLGTTKGTNALLERKGAKVAFVVTKGLKDVLEIGTQQRADLFQIKVQKEKPPYSDVFEVNERVLANGKISEPLIQSELRHLVNNLRNAGTNSVAVCLLNAYANPFHELTINQFLKKEGFSSISISTNLIPLIGMIPRAQSTVVNAYLDPILKAYLNDIGLSIHPDRLHIMTSAGGLVQKKSYTAKDSLLSGPAGGVIGSLQMGKMLGHNSLITFDMGGTSTDTARIDGEITYQYNTQVGAFELTTPCISIETVAAGGGSVCFYENGKLSVGPESAGAAPGPASYGAGGPLTLTDVNLLLGKLDPNTLPIPIHLNAAFSRAEELLQKIQRTDREANMELILQGLTQIANEKMAGAIRKISLEKGFDPASYAMITFGGAGGLHACKIAEELGINKLIFPVNAGLFSAYGIGVAEIERQVQKQVLQEISSCLKHLPAWIQGLVSKATLKLVDEGIPATGVKTKSCVLAMRFIDQSTTIDIPYHSDTNPVAKFKTIYRQYYGYLPQHREIELESIRITCSYSSQPQKVTFFDTGPSQPSPPGEVHIPVSADKSYPVFDWDLLCPGALIHGPALLVNDFASFFIEPQWVFNWSHPEGAIIQHKESSPFTPREQHREAINLELFTNRFQGIAEEMGAQLKRTAVSVNVKDRLDFSCALIDQERELLANALHIPVHLGSLGICARMILDEFPINKGDTIICNHPKYGGSHLPDITLLSGAFTKEGDLIGYVINRAHHAEIGGLLPGSMPPQAKSLEEEGVIIPPTYLIKNGKQRWNQVKLMLSGAKYPTRSIEENIADINAALAALQSGIASLQNLEAEHGLPKVYHYMHLLKIKASEALNKVINLRVNKIYHAIEQLDDGSKISVKITFKEDLVHFDFSGSSAVHTGNLNANRAIVHSAVIYFLRVLYGGEIPLNEGLMKKVSITLPECFLNPGFSDDISKCPAVVGGNTETSQRLIDTLIKAFSLGACGQGTMNNFVFGNSGFGYYETLGGGVGAAENYHGVSAIQQHMTNTRITDPEELERKYPVLIKEFSIRENSGGSGIWKGGNGIKRQLQFLEDVDVSFLTQHRVVPPFGMEGGESGKTGEQFITKPDGSIINMKGIDHIRAKAGDTVTILTPGGGGFGKNK